MTTRTRRPRKPKEGDVFAIPLGEGSYRFGQVAHTGDWAFFDLRAEGDDSLSRWTTRVRDVQGRMGRAG